MESWGGGCGAREVTYLNRAGGSADHWQVLAAKPSAAQFDHGSRPGTQKAGHAMRIDSLQAAASSASLHPVLTQACQSQAPGPVVGTLTTKSRRKVGCRRARVPSRFWRGLHAGSRGTAAHHAAVDQLEFGFGALSTGLWTHRCVKRPLRQHSAHPAASTGQVPLAQLMILS